MQSWLGDTAFICNIGWLILLADTDIRIWYVSFFTEFNAELDSWDGLTDVCCVSALMTFWTILFHFLKKKKANISKQQQNTCVVSIMLLSATNFRDWRCKHERY